MYQLNDDIQSLAQAFGERFFLSHAYMALEDECVHQGARRILEKTIYLHMITYLNDNMSWYLANGLISREAAKDLASKQSSAVKSFAPHMNDVLESFGLIMTPDVHAPIARDYVKFNSQTNMGDTGAAGKLFDFRKAATPKSQHMPRL